jgi:transposase InsO family protein
MESANGTVKVECVYAEHYTTREQARLSITEYLAYYNTERLHSSLGEVQLRVTRTAPDEAAMADNGRPFFQSWCVHESIRQRGSEAA